jgi:hypothetical protein
MHSEIDMLPFELKLQLAQVLLAFSSFPNSLTGKSWLYSVPGNASQLACSAVARLKPKYIPRLNRPIGSY